MKRVDDMLAWNIMLSVVLFMSADLIGFLIYILVWFSWYDGYLMWQVGLILFGLIVIFAGLITMLVFKIKKSWRIAHTH